MFERVKIQEWKEFFLDYSARRENGVYFYRIPAIILHISSSSCAIMRKRGCRAW